MVPLFKTLIRPVLENVWCPNLKKYVLLPENFKRCFTKTKSSKTKRIIGMKNIDYEDRLKSLNLELQWIRGDMVETCYTWTI